MLIATLFKNSSRFLDRYFELLLSLSYPRDLISLGFLESDSEDGTDMRLCSAEERLREMFRCVTIVSKNFDFKLKPEHRHRDEIQVQRQNVFSDSRNHLIKTCLRDEDYVLWIDSDFKWYPRNMIQHFLGDKVDIVGAVAMCEGKLYDLGTMKYGKPLDQLEEAKSTKGLIEVDQVVGPVYMVNAKIYRKGIGYGGYRDSHVQDSARFCKNAKKWGYKIFVDTCVVVEHLPVFGQAAL